MRMRRRKTGTVSKNNTAASNMAATTASRQRTMAKKRAIMAARKKAGQPEVQTKAQLKRRQLASGPPAVPPAKAPIRNQAMRTGPARRPTRANSLAAAARRPTRTGGVASAAPPKSLGAVSSPPPMKTPAPNPAAKRAALAKPMAPRGGIQPLKGK